jgi:DNA-binding XRE family transcriptional regulator
VNIVKQIDRMFDYEALAKEYNVNREALAQLEKEVRRDFPHDEMMFELHMIRALRWLNKQNQQ